MADIALSVWLKVAQKVSATAAKTYRTGMLLMASTDEGRSPLRNASSRTTASVPRMNAA